MAASVAVGAVRSLPFYGRSIDQGIALCKPRRPARSGVSSGSVGCAPDESARSGDLLVLEGARHLLDGSGVQTGVGGGPPPLTDARTTSAQDALCLRLAEAEELGDLQHRVDARLARAVVDGGAKQLARAAGRD